MEKMLSRQAHVAFYSSELSTIEESRKAYNSKELRHLVRENECHVGYLRKSDSSKATLVLKVKKDNSPRQFTRYYLGLAGAKTRSLGRVDNWGFTYQEFRESRIFDYQLGGRDGYGGEATTERCLRTDELYAYYQIVILDPVFSRKVRECIASDGEKGTLLVLAEPDPPVLYLEVLKEFVQDGSFSSALNFDDQSSKEEWTPFLVDNTHDITSEITNWVSEADVVVVQGPPGTGKSYSTAQYVDKLIEEGKTVCVTALANKALMEFATQPGLENAKAGGKVIKTNLTDVEQEAEPALRPLEKGMPESNTVLLSTYYKLASLYDQFKASGHRFDVLIIEEASQAFLATIALFSTLASKVLVVGDPMQLPPIVNTSQKRLEKLGHNISWAWKGMLLAGVIHENSSYRLTRSRRLTSASASQTNAFYDGTLRSISPLNQDADFEGDSRVVPSYFDSRGGVTLLKVPVADTRINAGWVKEFVKARISDILAIEGRKIAVLVPTKRLEISLAQYVSQLGDSAQNILVSTIHKAQGITVDYSIVYLPLKSTFDFNEHLVNVATSRARRGTLVITGGHLNLFSGVSPRVIDFFSRCIEVSVSDKIQG